MYKKKTINFNIGTAYEPYVIYFDFKGSVVYQKQ